MLSLANDLAYEKESIIMVSDFNNSEKTKIRIAGKEVSVASLMGWEETGLFLHQCFQSSSCPTPSEELVGS